MSYPEMLPKLKGNPAKEGGADIGNMGGRGVMVDGLGFIRSDSLLDSAVLSEAIDF